MMRTSTSFALRIFVKIVLALIVAGFLFYLCIYFGFFGEVPTKKTLKSLQNNSASEIYTADSVLIGRYFVQDRTNVSYESISPFVVKALVATEDARFYEHRGVDMRGLLRVIVKTILLQDESSGGGSTLSQQLAKNLYPRTSHRFFSTPINKVREMITAIRLESVYSKEEIIELYLNTVPMGGNIYGIERASRVFFNKASADLKMEEAAVLIGMLKANTTYNPARYPQRSLERRNVVIGQMLREGYISNSEADSIRLQPLVLSYNKNRAGQGIAPYLREYLRKELLKWTETHLDEDEKPYDLYTDGLKIYTTIDSRIQLEAERAVRTQMTKLQRIFDAHWRNQAPWGNNTSVITSAMQKSDRYTLLKEAGKSEEAIRETFNKKRAMTLFAWGGNKQVTMSPLDSIKYYQKILNTGLISIEPATGHVKAWVGGIHHQVFNYDHILSRRQVGSTFKPILYTAALEKGIDPCILIENKRVTYPQFENWSPQNADGRYSGKYSMKGALAYSVNTVSAQLMMQTGISQTISLAHRMGISSEIPTVPSISLGAASLSLLELVGAYTVFVNTGRLVKPVSITQIKDRDGRVIHAAKKSEGKQVISARNAATMLEMMRGVVDAGSASRLKTDFGLSMDMAGKTGTTQNQADGWFIGITPKLVTGVWVGAENPLVRFRSLKLGQGANTALPVWATFMKSLTAKPQFSSYRYSKFKPLNADVAARLNCPLFIEDEIIEEPVKKESFFKRIFKKGIGIFKKKKKDQNEPGQTQ
ncbi:penicillin-binding protein 1A [Arcticibacter pallidicorallinus]|uniref:Penicillin-binding protein 1A n=1 Tax=Arcticibacter pallidicorallinus TaxID=1259464 RepID=A0A2T0U519_9SPHI|nr:transglycosylase domain-containing protein [Arcticibacter pallidicorallinus]PRY53021.1 penicillin-binding protein 1A [Arcticibacter pallidicorallinus]